MTIEGRTMAAAEGGLRYGMVGGGRGAFIGGVHRQAIAMDGLAALTAACFSADHDNTLETGALAGVLARDRLYRNYRADDPRPSRRAPTASTSWSSSRPTASTSRRQAGARARHPRDVREAAGHVARGRARARRPGQAEEAAVRRRLHLHRLSRSSGTCARWWRAASWQTSASSPPSIPRSGWRRRSSGPGRSRRPGARTRGRPGCRTAWATSGATSSTWWRT